MVKGSSAFNTLTGKPTVKRPLGTSMRRREDNIKIDLQEMGINTSYWIDSARDRDYWRDLVNLVLKLGVP